MDGALVQALVAAAAGLAVFGLAYGARVVLNPERTARDRVADLTARPGDAARRAQQPSQVGNVAAKVGALARPQDAGELETQRRQLLQAGYRSANALEVFNGLRVVLLLVLALTGFLLTRQAAAIYIALGVMAGAAAGYYLPGVWVRSALEGRQASLMRSFPDALDLLVSSVEAGLGLDAAFRRVAKELEGPAPDLAAELQMVNYEVEAGVPRSEALRHLDQRTGLAEMNSLVNVLLQAERFGTSVAHALRVHANLVRKRRMLAAEENAARISPKLTVAMIVFILPSLFILLAGPAGINIMRTLLPAMGD